MRRPRDYRELIVLCLGLCILGLWVLFAWPGETADSSDALSFDLQKDSFCELPWFIAEFRIGLARQFADLLAQAQKARNLNQMDNQCIAEALEDSISQARAAIALDEMEECLLNFYRGARLTNKFQALFTQLQTRNTNRVILEPERRFLEGLTNSNRRVAR